MPRLVPEKTDRENQIEPTGMPQPYIAIPSDAAGEGPIGGPAGNACDY
jgi:hypothetical protein